MKAKLTKVMAMASLAAFLTVGIGANVAQAKDFRFTIGDSPRIKKNADGTWDSSANPWFKKGEKKQKKHKVSERDKHDKKKIAERSYYSMRSESSND
ncbi:hypothetical protein [uncultured Veillonella sp.]|uniref:hypothetical protein n=1 Tax=uncultured Veillonella sp. TaxID=159268 RepID=UPI0025F09D32|nr:hypothetical protein [uncultured Veillonella sp.]